ncbi:MAG: hypothetical protein IPK89_13975 [Sphingomonadales bacterium]|nr:hypothetical protein [Sphingomonadales bacterium]
MNRDLVLIAPLPCAFRLRDTETRLRTGPDERRPQFRANRPAWLTGWSTGSQLIQLRRIASLKNFQKERIRDT